MFPYTRNVFILVFGLVFMVMAGCSSTKLVSSWSDPTSMGQPVRSCLIVAVMDNEIHQKMYEDEFVKRLGEVGVQGIPAYRLITNTQAPYKESDIRAVVQKSGVDSAIIARLQDEKKQKRYVPPTYRYEPAFGYRRGFYPYYGMSHRYVSTPGYTTVDTIVELETTVFSAVTGKMIWAGTTSSFNPSTPRGIIEKNISIQIKEMQKAGFIEKK